MGKYRKMAKSRRRKIRKSCFSFVFPMNFWPKSVPGPPSPQLIILTKYGRISTTPDPFCNDFTFLFFFEKKLFQVLLKYFLYFYVFVKLRKLRDPSQIVDLAESFRSVPLRPPETIKNSKWCQNNVPKRSKKYF